MNRKHASDHFIVLALFVSLLTNTVVWTFHEGVIMHELDHRFYAAHESGHHDHHHHHAHYDHDHEFPALTESVAHQPHFGVDENDLDFTVHLILHAAGHFQPFYLMQPPCVSVPAGKAVHACFSPTIIPESIPDSPFRPPRNTTAV